MEGKYGQTVLVATNNVGRVAFWAHAVLASGATEHERESFRLATFLAFPAGFLLVTRL